ncbi:cytochrome b/b6 domain-containing protein [Glutamicibacter sp. PAEs-4]|uniref:cytochrome b/b6 domain-containing protein n=1 Tax=Glutamicibacter sp. PAEs-4 TaxID=3444114 RepID=UPI003EB970CC
MTASEQSIRQGLPRVAGGEPWPPAELFASVVAIADATVAEPTKAEPVAEPVLEQPVSSPAPAEPTPAETPAVAAASAASAQTVAGQVPVAGSLRRGLPRVAGGEPWPPAGIPVAASAPAAATQQVSAAVPASEPATTPVAEPAKTSPVEAAPAASEPVPPANAAPVAANSSADAPAVRRGLPRTAGAEAWPPSSFVAAPVAAAAPAATAEPAEPAASVPENVAVAAPVAPAPVAEDAQAAPAKAEPAPAEPVAQASSAKAAPSATADETPAAPARTRMGMQQSAAPAAPAVAAEKASSAKPAITPKPQASAKSKKEAVKHGPLTNKQWVLAGIVGAFAALGLATAVVLIARGIAGIDGVESFMERYPGEYHLPESAPIGFPGWLAWNHFFNFFLMVLIIRSGMLVRHQKKPPAYWSSKRSPKVSINLWLHQGLDLLWLVNGLVFLVLLFATGHWMRIVPTSWEVFPNAISAALQYLTLDWPTENGWVNYNSLQQLAYFTTVFIAAPVAAITGYRMSAFWPKNMPALAKKYPIEVARALHFPTMLYFVLFILVHVILVFSTGALRNLNHMYAAQGSTDPAAYADNWAGLLYFALSLLVIAGAWLACRLMILASIARLFGKVSAR